MKFVTCCIIAAYVAVFSAFAGETVILGPGYANDVFYHLEGRAKSGEAPNANWDIAFETTGFTGSILVSGGNAVNGAIGATLWSTDLKGIDGFAGGIDTTALFATPSWNNSHETWHKGAFNMDKNAAAGDFGWGIYNPATHEITGTAVFVIKLPSGAVRKIFMDGLNGDDFTFRHANIDGSDLQVKTFKRSDYAKKNFVYFSFQTGQFIDREPESAEWNLVFGKYLTILTDQGNAPYSVTGVRTNNDVKVAKYKGDNPAGATSDGLTFAENMTGIGHDWKSFSGTAYIVADDVAYFVQIPNGAIFKIIFTSFSGSSTGNIGFTIDDASTSVQEQSSKNALAVFPNPASGVATIAFNTLLSGDLTLTDALGQVVRTEHITNGFHALDLTGLSQGSYIIALTSGTTRLARPLIVR